MDIKRLLIITGTPGTGKSTIAKLLISKLHLLHIDLYKIIKNDDKLAANFNLKKDCYDLDMKVIESKVVKILLNNPSKIVVFDSHVAHLLNPELIVGAILMKCSDLKKLNNRLKSREYSKSKIKENLDCEIFDVCLDEVRALKVPLLQFDSGVGYDEEDVVNLVKSFLSKNSS